MRRRRDACAEDLNSEDGQQRKPEHGYKPDQALSVIFHALTSPLRQAPTSDTLLKISQPSLERPYVASVTARFFVKRVKARDVEAETVCSRKCDDVLRLLRVTWMEAAVGHWPTTPTAKSDERTKRRLRVGVGNQPKQSRSPVSGQTPARRDPYLRGGCASTRGRGESSGLLSRSQFHKSAVSDTHPAAGLTTGRTNLQGRRAVLRAAVGA